MGYWSDLLQEAKSNKVLDDKRAEVERATRVGSTVKGAITGAVAGGLLASGAGKDKIASGAVAGSLFGAMFGHAAGKDHATSEGLKVARTHQRLRDYLKRDPDADELDIAYGERKARENKAAWNKAGNALKTGAKVAATGIALKQAYDNHQVFQRMMGKREAEPVEIKQDYMARSTFAEAIQENPMHQSTSKGWWELEVAQKPAETAKLTEGTQAPASNRSVMNDANANFRRGSEPGPWGRSKSFAEHIADDFRAQNPRNPMHYEQPKQQIQGRYGVVRESMIDEFIKKADKTYKIGGTVLGGLGGAALGTMVGKGRAGAAIGAGLGAYGTHKTAKGNADYIRKQYEILKKKLDREPTEAELDQWLGDDHLAND